MELVMIGVCDGIAWQLRQHPNFSSQPSFVLGVCVEPSGALCNGARLPFVGASILSVRFSTFASGGALPG